MKHIQIFETEDAFAEASLETPWVTLTEDDGIVHYSGNMEEIQLPPNNEIWYTTNTGNIVNLSNDYEGEQPISNTYENGKGIMRFANDVTDLSEAFDDEPRLTSVIIPNSVTNVGYYAFYDCNNLTSINIPNSVTCIDQCSFRDCNSLTSIDIPDSVTYIGDNAFDGCTSLTNVIIGNSVTNIRSHAFLGCSNLTSVTIGNSITQIGWWAFQNCSKLTSVTYKGIEYTSESALTTALTNNGVTVGTYVFENTDLSA